MQRVRNRFDTVGEITRSFEYSPKKESLLVQKVKDVCPDSRRHKLLDVCKTRWIQRRDGLKVFLELYKAIVATIETIKTNGKKVGMQIQLGRQLAITTPSLIFISLLP